MSFTGPLERPTHSYKPEYNYPKSDLELANKYREFLKENKDDKTSFYFFCNGISNLLNLPLEVDKMSKFVRTFIRMNRPSMKKEVLAGELGLSVAILQSWESDSAPDDRSVVFAAARIFPEYFEYLLGEREETPACLHTDKGVHPGKICS